LAVKPAISVFNLLKVASFLVRDSREVETFYINPYNSVTRPSKALGKSFLASIMLLVPTSLTIL
jgi:hypothetical protein